MRYTVWKRMLDLKVKLYNTNIYAFAWINALYYYSFYENKCVEIRIIHNDTGRPEVIL